MLSSGLAALYNNRLVIVPNSDEPAILLFLAQQAVKHAIALILEPERLDSGVDYRLRHLEQAELYHFPLNDASEASLRESFKALTHNSTRAVENDDLVIENRTIRALRTCDDVAWFDFRELCDGPRSQNDYIELGKIFNAVILSGVEQMDVKTDDIARRFINMVDEFYDRGVKLIISAEVELKDLYTGGRLNFEFQRTLSRLLEMQSHEYLTRAHKP